MTNISNIGGSTRVGSSGDAQAQRGISAEQFLDILIAELRYQNPMEPMKNHELMQQMTQIRNLQATNTLVEQLQRMTSGMELASAAELVGEPVYGYAENGTRVVGEVQGLWTQNGRVNLVVEGFPLLPVDNVECSGIDLTEAVALIGDRIRGHTRLGAPALGVVVDVVIRQGRVNLLLDNYQILPLENVEEVIEEAPDDGQ